MSLPDDFDSPVKYFEAALCFLNEFSWIYKSSNTNFIKDNVLDKMPSDWQEYFQTISNDNLNRLPENANQDPIPKSLKRFQDNLKILKPKPLANNFSFKDDNSIYFRKMSPKKLHEISRLSQIIVESCGNDIDVLIDFGSGLGYLSEILYGNTDYKIIGLECDEQRIASAKQRQDSSSKNRIFYINCLINEDSGEFIQDQVTQLFPDIKNPRIAIIGLHACADLTITSMKLFYEMINVQQLIIMPCCYHKLQLLSGTKNQQFTNFPLSKSLRNVNNCGDFLNRPFLRLACQQTASRWKTQSESEHFKHANEMFIRAVLQSILRESEIVTKIRNNRHTTTTIITNPEDYSDGICVFNEILKQYQIKSKNGTECDWTEEHRQHFNQILLKYPQGYRLTEGLTCLQTSLQELCENLVLYDRLCYMDEQAELLVNFNVCTNIVKIMDDKLSPRCFVLISKKNIATASSMFESNN